MEITGELKKFLLIGVLSLIIGGLTGCSTNEKKSQNNRNPVMEENPKVPSNSDFEKMTTQESSTLKCGDVIEKEADRGILEKKGLDYVYIYNVEVDGRKYSPIASYGYDGKRQESISTKSRRIVFTFSHMEVVEIYYGNSQKTGKLVKKMNWKHEMIEAEPIYLELAKEKVKTLK